MEMTLFPASLMLLLVCGALALDYSDLEGLGASCEGYDSCDSPKMSKDFTKRNCECDAECREYGDCCIDAKWAPDAHSPSNAHLCMGYGSSPNRGAYVIRGCPTASSSPSEARCLNPDPADPVVGAPVSLLREGARPLHYFNAHCAECNGADLSRLVPWTPMVACASLAHYNLSAPFVWASLEWSQEGRWVVPYKGQMHACTVLYDVPRQGLDHRPCRAELVSSCPPGYRRGAVRRMCGAYEGVVYTARGAAYRNAHCALCNGAGVEELYCDAEELLSGRNKFSIALLFDVNPEGGAHVGGCADGQVYDAFHKKCRNLVCGIPGQVLVNGKCQMA